jgi:hypothetical protein
VGSNPTLSASKFRISNCGFGKPVTNNYWEKFEIRNPQFEILQGEVQEWLNWQHWKCCERETVPWVRIPPSPPVNFGFRLAKCEFGNPRRKRKLMKLRLFEKLIMPGVLSTFVLTIVAGQSHVSRQRIKLASICGNPMIACTTTAIFQPNDLPFRVPKDAVIIDTVPFYAIILRSTAASADNCDVIIPETDRRAAQALFPDHKVFSSRCTDPENLRYMDMSKQKSSNLSDTYRIMAVYAGTSLPEAKRFLETVKATGKFPGANLRRMSTGYNGT